MNEISILKTLRTLITYLSLCIILSPSTYAEDKLPKKAVVETDIPIVSKMAKIPKPYIMRNWPEVSRKYYEFLLRPNHKVDGKVLMPVTEKNGCSPVFVGN